MNDLTWADSADDGSAADGWVLWAALRLLLYQRPKHTWSLITSTISLFSSKKKNRKKNSLFHFRRHQYRANNQYNYFSTNITIDFD